MDAKSESAECPYCHEPMQAGYFLVGGGVWFSKATIEPFVPGRIDGAADVLAQPFHTIVAAKGFRLGPENWPKPGYFCEECLAIVLKVRSEIEQ
jgi:hypothetical protein